MPVPGGAVHRKAPERLPDAAETPWESRISSRSVGPGSEDPEVPIRRVAVRRGAEDESTRGDVRARARATVRGGALRRGATTSWNHGRGTRAGGLKGAGTFGTHDLIPSKVRGRGAPRAMARSRRGNASRPHRSKGSRSRNPMSGSGCHVPAKVERAQTVEGAKNPADGSCRVRQTRDQRISSSASLEGRKTPGGAIRPGRAGEGVMARTLRGHQA